MLLENHSKTAKRLRGTDTRPGHRGKTLAGAILATKTLTVASLYDQAISVLRSNLANDDLKAAIFAIEQVDGKAKQKIDVTSKDKQINTSPIFFTDDKELKDIVKKLSSGE